MKKSIRLITVVFLAVLMSFCSIFAATTPVLSENNMFLTASAVSRLARAKNLKASAVNYSSVTLKWDKVSGAQKYAVYKYIKSENKNVKIGESSSLSFKVTNLKASTTYMFAVRAYKKTNGKIHYGPYSARISVNTDAKPLLNISSLRITTENKSKNLKLTWNKLSYASGYQIYRSTTGKTGSYKKIATLKSAINTYRDTNLKSSTVYYYAVRAFKKTNKGIKYGNLKKADLSTKLTKAYIDKLWEKANHVYSNWLYGCAYADWDDYFVVEDGTAYGRSYCKVNHKTIKSVKDLKKLVRKYFAEDTLNESYLYNKYIDYNGNLYVSCEGVGSTMDYCNSTKIISASDKKYKYRMYVSSYIIFDEEERNKPVACDHTLIYKGHRWIFTGRFWTIC